MHEHCAIDLPPGFLQRVEHFGVRQNELRFGRTDRDNGDLEFVAWQLSEANRNGFIDELSRCALSAGGWTVLGAHKLIGCVSGWDVQTPARLELFDAALNWMSSNGYVPLELNSYEARRMAAQRCPLF